MELPSPGSTPCRIDRQERYCLGLMGGLSKVEAYRAAGYTGSTHGGTAMLEKHDVVKARLAWLRKQSSERAVNANAVTRSEIVESVRDTRRRAKEGTPVIGRNGKPSEICKPDFAAAWIR